MLNFSKFKVILILLPCLWALITSLPHLNYSLVEKANDAKDALRLGKPLSKQMSADIKSWPGWLPSDIVNLGLDLRGGAHLLVEVSVEDVYQEKLDSIWSEARARLRDIRDSIGGIRRLESIDTDTLTIKIENINGIDDALREIRELARPVVSLTSVGKTELDLMTEGDKIIVKISAPEKVRLNDLTMAQSLEIIRRRVDEAGTREPSIQRQGARRILVQVPGIGSAEELLNLIGKTAKLTFHPVISTRSDREIALRLGQIILPAAEGGQYYLLEKKYVVSGNELTNSQPSFDQNNQPAVSFQFNPSGGRKFGSYTKQNIGSPFAIVLDGEVISAPIIQSHIPGGSGIITGNFSVEESNRLAILLRAGALPAEIKVFPFFIIFIFIFVLWI